ncbi:MAG: GGDEF domain-containing protein, partial [Pseudomonadota bacterium]
LKQRTRAVDRVFRMGGEEFLILLDDTDIAGAKALAESLRRSMTELAVADGRQLTVSIGLAELNGTERWDDWIKRADDQLYRAKTAGRNRVHS